MFILKIILFIILILSKLNIAIKNKILLVLKVVTTGLNELKLCPSLTIVVLELGLNGIFVGLNRIDF
ncbi:MAG: hypothetical protein RLZZ628_791 [Bacteroidota bacterium]